MTCTTRKVPDGGTEDGSDRPQRDAVAEGGTAS